MNVLVACEESQRVCTQFRLKGHRAFSCDIIECSGNHPEWHIKGDVIPLLNGNCDFRTQDGGFHRTLGKWDMIIAFPPCTHLAVSGAAHFKTKRLDGRQREGIEFFCKFFEADCDKISIENPINIISGTYVYEWFPDIAMKYGLPIKPTQRIQPYYFGDHARKATCLWLKGLPRLIPTNLVDPGEIMDGGYSVGAHADGRGADGKWLKFNDPELSRLRSKTFPGIAKAMGEQWG